MDSENEIVNSIETDDFYRQFLGSHSKAILVQSLAFTEQIKKLGEGIELLNNELQKQVVQNHDDLLRQASHASKLENILNIMNVYIQNLFANAERLRSQITVPYEQLEGHTMVLGRLHRASHILRQVSRVQQLSKRLSSTNDPIQKATLLQELEQLAADPELVGIDAVTTEIRNVRIQQQNVVKLATVSLNQGISNENSSQTSTALQIFNNLGLLETTLENEIKQHLDECGEALKSALDSANSSYKLKSGKITSQGFRTKIWNELEKAFTEDIFNVCKRIKFLQLTLNEVPIKNFNKNVADKFWKDFGKMLQKEIEKATSAAVQTLEEDFPKFLKLHVEVINKLSYDKFKFNRIVLKKLENSYLSGSLTRILDPVQGMFGEDTPVPTQDEIDSLIRVLTSELSVALVEEHLSEQVAKNVGKSVKMFAVKTEQRVGTGVEAAQILAASQNSIQQKNVQFANALYYLQAQIQRMLNNMKESLSDTGIELINETLEQLDALTGAIIQPLIVSINSVVETIIITMHAEPDWTKLPVSTLKPSSSPYMKELAQFLIRVYNSYLIHFYNKEVLIKKCNEVALRCIDLLVRHASILRPISQGGRQRLQQDFDKLEDTLKVITPQLATLGRPYRLLKSMASLITQSPEEIVQGQGPGSSMPHSTVLLMLFSFGGSDLASPHQNTGWSLQKLSAWLDEHPNESDRLDLVAGALQKYVSVIRMLNSTNYDPVYPLMRDLLERVGNEA